MNDTLTSLHTSLLVDYREETYQSFFSISHSTQQEVVVKSEGETLNVFNLLRSSTPLRLCPFALKQVQDSYEQC